MSSPNSANDIKGGMISSMIRRHSADDAARGSFFFRSFTDTRDRQRTVSEVVPEHSTVGPSETSQKERRISVMSLSPI